MSESVSKAVEKQRNTPAVMVRQYAADFREALPTHIKPETWLRVAIGALKRGKRIQLPSGEWCTELELAASNNPAKFMAALLEAARLGLEPGTDGYYLTPRKEKGRLEILGIVGYMGWIELMYRAGATASVIADVVYTNDVFAWTPGKHDTQDPPRWRGPQVYPFHDIDWDAENRGQRKLVYAYAHMINGAVSRVVVLNRAQIAKIRKKSEGSSSDYSPWNNWEDDMWLKSSIRRLRKWVPTSPEWLVQQVKAIQAAGGQVALRNSQGAAVDLSGSPEPLMEDYVDGEPTAGEDDARWAEVVAYEQQQGA